MSSHRNRGASRAMALLCGLTASFATSLVIAQDKPEEKTMDEVVVTGSRIARPNLESPVPVTTVSSEELFQTGTTSVGDLLNDLPALRSTFSQSNSSRFLGTTGLNLLDLRGLGTQRTLVLVNGRRHVGADILSNAVSPDVNTFPTDLIERIDVVTGGNSAVYGSDAIAGVVNFVLKKDFTGLQFRGQAGTSDEGDAGNYYGSILGGTNFMDDRGNIAFNFEFAKQDAWFASQRDAYRNNVGFRGGRLRPVAEGSDGVPDRRVLRRRPLRLGRERRFIPDREQRHGADAHSLRSGSARRALQLLVHLRRRGFARAADRRAHRPCTHGQFQWWQRHEQSRGNLLAIYPQLDRYSFNLFGHLEISEAFTPFIEAKYVRTDSIRYGSPAFFQGGTTGAAQETVRFDNPFLTPQARAALQQARVNAGFTTPYADTDRLALRKNLIEFGPRREDATRETTRIVLGVEGQMTRELELRSCVQLRPVRRRHDRSRQHEPAALRACHGRGDSTRPVRSFAARRSIRPRRSSTTPASHDVAVDDVCAGDIAACAPLNPFGQGNISQAARDFVLQDTTSVGQIKQQVFSATVTGDSSALFSLPAGAIGIALGFEQRTEENFFEADELVSSGITFYNALPLFDPPKFKVSEVFTELRVPLLKELPFAEELTLNLAGRFADYDGNTGEVFAYNAGLDWSPISSLRFRAGLARAVRAPSLVDLYSEQSQNFATINDPCAARFIGAGASTRAANCAAAGIPATYDYVYPSTPEILSGGNPELLEETSDSLTVGFVFQPEFAPGLSFSADYFDIEIDDVITAPTAQQIMNACYDASDIDNQFCGLFQRWGAAGGPTVPGSCRCPYALMNGTLQQTLLNYASSMAEGIDFELGYSHSAGDAGNIKTRLLYTLMLDRTDFLDPSNPADGDQGLLELGDPKDAFNLNVDYEVGAVSIGYQLRYIGKQVLFNYEDTYSLPGRAAAERGLRRDPLLSEHDVAGHPLRLRHQ